MYSLKKILLREYSEKTITNTIERWKQDKSDLDDAQARAIINRFDQVKSGLSQKLSVLNISDDLKQNSNFLNIDKYSLSDMVSLLRSIPEKEDKVKKEAVKKFNKETGIPEASIQSYVARFFSNKQNIQFAAKEGNDHYSKEEILNFIPKNLHRDEMFLDPRNWRWEAFEQMMDALYPSQAVAGEEDENLAATDADKVYEQNGFEVYKGDDVNKCISYSPKLDTTQRKKYGWCVSQVGNTNYDYYRFEDRSPTFYFVFDRNKPSSPEHSPFDDKWHSFVVQVNKNNEKESYRVTSANNDSDTRAESWEGISKIVPPETWSLMKGLKDIFTPIDLSPIERGRKFASGKNLSKDEFLELSTEEKTLYIQGKASKNGISNEILSLLPQFKIPLDGRSTTLANVAIDNGQKFPYSALKEYPALAKRYAIFRFRHTDYATDAIPLPYLQYLDEAAKKKYLDNYDDSLNFDYVKRFFGESILKPYINDKAKVFDYIPDDYVKYIEDTKIRGLYSIINKLQAGWTQGDTYGIDEDQLDDMQDAPEQLVSPVPMLLADFEGLTTTEKKIIIELAKQYKGEEYAAMIFALPYVIKKGDKYLFMVPIDEDSIEWALVDESNNILRKYEGSKITLGEDKFSDGAPDYARYDKLYDIEDVDGIEINESKYSFLAEIKVNVPKHPYFNKWKEDIIHSLDGLIDVDELKNFINPLKAIEFLQDEDIFVQTQDVIDHNMYFINNGNYNSGIYPYSTTEDDENLLEIKVGKPQKYKEEDYKYWISAIYEDCDNGGDIYDIFERCVPQEILDDPSLGQIEFWDYVPLDKRNQLIDNLKEFHKQYKENIEERYIKETLMFRAGLR